MARRVHRVEVRAAHGHRDPRGESLAAGARREGIALRSARSARVYLIEADLSEAQVRQAMGGLLVDEVRERGTIGSAESPAGSTLVEVHPLPGVMDPAAQSVREAIRALLGVDAGVSTGWRYDVEGVDGSGAEVIARRLLANPVVHSIVVGRAFHPDSLPAGHEQPFRARTIGVRELDDGALAALSRDAHLFLSLDEMRAIRTHARSMGRDPTDIELETIAQTWSEHCVHKTLKSRVRYREGGTEARGQEAAEGRRVDPINWEGRPGHVIHPDGTVEIDNLLKRTVAAATFELIDEGCDWALSVFQDNAGVIAFDDHHALCVKVETHNHPSAIEPYGGAATGVGGCIRDVIATGLGARPIANTDVFCVAHPDARGADLPPGTIHPRRILSEVVAGVRDYGNRMGIPTVSGAVAFDDRYVGNPLVFCGCVGLMRRDLIRGRAREGDLIVAIGGRTGRDGIHGATFSSAELTGTHADEFAHAVQIGNAIEEKRVLDAVLGARDEGGGPLYHALTDCGAGGFSSAVGEMGKEVGAHVDLDRAPLKYAGLTHTEIWISEAQERLVLAVPERNLPALRRICEREHVELAVLGGFGTPGRELVLRYRGVEVGRLSMGFLHEGIPQVTREATWAAARPGGSGGARDEGGAGTRETLLRVLAHPSVASKHWIVEQYDHEVQGNTVLKPLVGPRGRGPGDASVLEPAPGSGRGAAIACGLATGIGNAPAGGASRAGDPYLMALAAIDECVRNLVCVGADPDRVAILDNFCWPSCAKERNLGALVRACAGCYDGAKAYRTPFVSGKDSLNNQFTFDDPRAGRRTIEIPFTLLITGLGIVPRLDACVTMDAKSPGNLLVLVGPRGPRSLGGSIVEDLGLACPIDTPRVDLVLGPAIARRVARAIDRSLVRSAHDVSEGGLLACVGEMLIAGASGERSAASIGARLSPTPGDPFAWGFHEGPSRYVLEVERARLDEIRGCVGAAGIGVEVIGELTGDGRLAWPGGDLDVSVEDLDRAWRSPLDW